MAELVGTYSSLPLGTTDASVIAVAERLNVAEVATLDRQVIGSSPIAGARASQPASASIVSPLTCDNAGREGTATAQQAPSRGKSPQPARGAGRPAGSAKPDRPLCGSVLASGNGRTATRSGAPVIEVEHGITVYPAREDQGRWRAVWHENGQRQQCEAVSFNRGMMAAAHLAFRQGRIPATVVEQHRQFIPGLGLPVQGGCRLRELQQALDAR